MVDIDENNQKKNIIFVLNNILIHSNIILLESILESNIYQVNYTYSSIIYSNNIVNDIKSSTNIHLTLLSNKTQYFVKKPYPFMWYLKYTNLNRIIKFSYEIYQRFINLFYNKISIFEYELNVSNIIINYSKRFIKIVKKFYKDDYFLQSIIDIYKSIMIEGIKKKINAYHNL